MKNNSLITRIKTDSAFSARILMYIDAAVNIGFAVLHLVRGLINRSFWSIALAIYYFSVCIIKLVIIYSAQRHKTENDVSDEWKTYRVVGWLILALNVTLSGIFIQAVWQGKSASYPGIMIFAMAAYAFYRIIATAVNLIKGRHRRAPILSASRVTDFCVAAVSIYTLQTALLHTYTDNADEFVSFFNMITGVAVLAIILALAVFMIVKSRKKRKSCIKRRVYESKKHRAYRSRQQKTRYGKLGALK